jgi:uncharacterized surface protein with fasciclin (FAS1) repeats
MEKHMRKLPDRLFYWLIGLVTVSTLLVSCKDVYLYDNQEPDWLGESIYDELVRDGHFKYIVSIIDSVKYRDVLSRTGSKTIFVANDEAFDRFFQNGNPWGVTSFDQLTLSQKKLILNFSMINNAYLIETLSNYYTSTGGGLQEGKALRRKSAVNILDSVAFEKGDKLPYGAAWDSRRQKGMWLLKDNTDWTMVHFLKKQLDFNGISNEDFKTMTGITRTGNDAYIFSDKVVERDRACKNGYINVLENVLIPPTNMAQYVRSTPQLSTFAKLLDRYCAPYYDPTATMDYQKLENRLPVDSIFTLRYFTEKDRGGVQNYPNGLLIQPNLYLAFDPGWNNYSAPNASMQSDMAVLFAPTDEALADYFNLNSSGSGRALKERYNTWDNVPNNILIKLVKRHMRTSLLNSIPSVFNRMVDAQSSKLNAKPSDIIDSMNYVGINGLVYVTKAIYPPDDFVSVYGPVLFSKRTEVCNWAIEQYLYALYLNSMVNKYAFLAPTDKAMGSYIDPLTYGTSKPTTIKFWYDYVSKKVNASIFAYDQTKPYGRGDSITLITYAKNPDFIKSRLVRILDQCIVVNDFKDTVQDVFKDGYYVTKDGNILKASNTNDIEGHYTSNLVNFQGGDNIVKDTRVYLADSGLYHQENGTTYFIDQLPQTPFRSVYNVLSTNPAFSEFYNICKEFPSSNVFVQKTNYFGIDYNIKFFNTFRYTVYVPTNEAIQEAYTNGTLIPWSTINAQTNQARKDSMIRVMERFVRYHFQDNSVFIHPDQPVDALYQSATIKTDNAQTYWETYKNKFYRIGVKSANGTLKLTTEHYSIVGGEMVPETAEVVTSGNNYNIMTRDYVFSLDPKTLTSLLSPAYAGSSITTSSTAVIHQINKVLRFQ